MAALAGDAGGGGRGGGGGPTFVAPDEAAVREGLNLFIVATIGEADGSILDEATALFLTTARRDFDDKNAQHDPVQAAKDLIRGTAAYKDIHELRPESMDELKWVTSPQGQLRKMGVTGATAESLGIELARVGGSQEGIQRAGESAFTRQTGRVHTDQRNRLKAKASAAASLL